MFWVGKLCKFLEREREGRVFLEEDLEVARRQVIHLYGDSLVSHFDFVFFFSFTVYSLSLIVY